MTRKLRIEVAIRLVGEPVGVTQQAGILEQLLRVVQVECLPADIVQKLTLDVSGLRLDESVFVRDLKTPSNQVVLTPGHIAVASVHLPAAEEEAKAAEAEEEVDAAAPAEDAADAKPDAKDAKEPAKDAKAPAKDGKEPEKKEKK